MELEKIIDTIIELKKEIDSLRPIDADTEKRIMQKFRLDWNYHSNSIEGNSLTFGETKSFLLHGITADGKPLKDHLDMKGHNEALLLLDDVVKEHRPLTETFIREVHQIILHEPYDRPAKTPDGKPTTKKIKIGQYKEAPNHVETATGEMFYFATPEETPAKMHDLMEWYKSAITGNNGRSIKMYPWVIAAEFHYEFIRIHPFDDGNGRMARILMNLILMKDGYPPVIIKKEEKDDYYRALRIADGGDVAHFTKYIGEQLIKSMELYLKGAKGENIDEADDLHKKFAVLNAELKSEDILKEPANYKNIAESIHEHVFPLCMMTEENIGMVKEHFLDFERTIQFQIDGQSGRKQLGSNDTAWDTIKLWLFREAVNEKKQIRNIGFYYSLKGFKKTIDARNLSFSISAYFDEFNYKIQASHKYGNNLTLPYGKKLSTQDLSKFITPVLDELIQSIRELKAM